MCWVTCSTLLRSQTLFAVYLRIMLRWHCAGTEIIKNTHQCECADICTLNVTGKLGLNFFLTRSNQIT